MARTTALQCTVITPERRVFDAAVDFVALPAHDGEIGILRNHAPLLCKLGIGILRIHAADGLQSLFVDGGFAEVRDNHAVILTERAARREEINRSAEEAALASARDLRPTDADAQLSRRRDIQRASAKLTLAR